MFEPPAGTEDFAADANTAETATEPQVLSQDTAEVLSPDEESAAIERQIAQLKERQAAVARRDDQPQVIDSTGAVLEPADAVEPEVWPHHTIEIQGKQVQVKTPSAAAIRFLAVFGFGEERVARGDFANFMNRHVSEKSVEEIRGWTYDGEIDEHFYDELQKRIFTLGTNRPTGPRRSSPRSR